MAQTTTTRNTNNGDGYQSIKNTTKPGTVYDTTTGKQTKVYSTTGVQVINNGTFINKPMVKQISAEHMEAIGKERKMLQFTMGETYYLVKSYKVTKNNKGDDVDDPFSVGIYRPRNNYTIVL